MTREPQRATRTEPTDEQLRAIIAARAAEHPAEQVEEPAARSNDPAVPATEELREISAARTDAEPVPPETITLPPGSRKVAIYRPTRREECVARARVGGKPVPCWVVYEFKDGEPAADTKAHHVFAFSGPEVESQVNMRGGRPFADSIPSRIPGTAPTEAGNCLDEVGWFFHTEGELTLHMVPRPEVQPAPRPKVVQELPPLPAMPVPDFSTAGLADAVRLVARVISEASPHLKREGGHAPRAAELMSRVSVGLYGLGL
jgi:hypothetical protein